MLENEIIAIDRLTGKPYGDDTKMDQVNNPASNKELTEYKELTTNGMITEGQPWTVREIAGSGLIVWDNTIINLPQAADRIGNKTIILNADSLSNLPVKGLASVLGDQWKLIIEESGILNPNLTGFIGINQELKLLSAWKDNEYWPNNDKGGH
jgi:hypothetical protein